MKFLASERWPSLSLTLFDALVCYFPLFFLVVVEGGR